MTKRLPAQTALRHNHNKPLFSDTNGQSGGEGVGGCKPRGDQAGWVAPARRGRDAPGFSLQEEARRLGK